MGDKVYVIYFDNVMFKDNGRKTAYLEIKYAKQVITSESRRIAKNMYWDENNKDWYSIGEEGKKVWLDKAKARFEVREFVERKVAYGD